MIAFLVVTIHVVHGQAIATKEITIAKGWSQTSVNATIFRRNSIVSHNEYQYVAFYDSTAAVVLAKRKLTSNDWEIVRTRYTGNVADAHNVIAIGVDALGYIHMAWDHHGNHLNYCVSKVPESLDMGDKVSMIGQDETNVTYPEFYRLRNGNLLFVYRDGASGNGNMVMNRYDASARRWDRVQSNLIDGEGKRNAYWQLCVSGKGTIHVSWVWRETSNVESNHDLLYAKSEDEGKTWRNSSGKAYVLPIREVSAERMASIPEKSDLINQTSIITDASDNPYTVTYYRKPGDSAPQFYVHYLKKNHWYSTRVGFRKTDFSLSGAGSRSIPVSRPQVLFDDLRQKLVVIFRDEDFGGKAVMAQASVRDFQWEITELTRHSLDRWEPSYDTELWRTQNILHFYVQKVAQGSGEKSVAIPAQPVRVLEVNRQ
ncbi:neuraminidase [Pseudochryseolinea flava]|uniref:Neuraminidase n=2 Tax=Pseudochryseolinea flava TaxID=2059302 RepID=A0A364XVQ7_9BACT|nr:neuraminidase [Pseudochryseolinea flava]